MGDHITPIHPFYWGDPNSSGRDMLPIECNDTPSLRWDHVPALGSQETEDHMHTALQLLFHQFVYLNKSELVFEQQGAHGQVTSTTGDAPTSPPTEEAHAAFLPGVLVTTRQELSDKGLKARWVALAGSSHLGRCFQCTHRLDRVVNLVDRAAEKPLRSFCLQLCRLVSLGHLAPTDAFESFCRHAVGHFVDLEERFLGDLKVVCRCYIRVIEAYVLSIETNTLYWKLLRTPRTPPEESINVDEYAKELQYGVAYELFCRRRYQDLCNGVYQLRRPKVNAFLFGLVPLPFDQSQACLALQGSPLMDEHLTSTAQSYKTTVEEDSEFCNVVKDELRQRGIHGVIADLESGRSPIKSAVKDLHGPVHHADHIAFYAVVDLLDQSKINVAASEDADAKEKRAVLAWFVSQPPPHAFLRPSDEYEYFLSQDSPISPEDLRRAQQRAESGAEVACVDRSELGAMELLPRLVKLFRFMELRDDGEAEVASEVNLPNAASSVHRRKTPPVTPTLSRQARTERTPYGQGISNAGATCYMNAIIVLLHGTVEDVEASSGDLSPETKCRRSIRRELNTLSKHLRQASQPIDSSGVVRLMQLVDTFRKQQAQEGETWTDPARPQDLRAVFVQIARALELPSIPRNDDPLLAFDLTRYEEALIAPVKDGGNIERIRSSLYRIAVLQGGDKLRLLGLCPDFSSLRKELMFAILALVDENGIGKDDWTRHGGNKTLKYAVRYALRALDLFSADHDPVADCAMAEGDVIRSLPVERSSTLVDLIACSGLRCDLRSHCDEVPSTIYCHLDRGPHGEQGGFMVSGFDDIISFYNRQGDRHDYMVEKIVIAMRSHYFVFVRDAQRWIRVDDHTVDLVDQTQVTECGAKHGYLVALSRQ